MNWKRFGSGCVVALAWIAAHAYEIETHAQITDAAFDRSALGVDTVLTDRLGITDVPGSLGTRYYDIGDSTALLRRAIPFDSETMPVERRANDTERIRGWLMRGVVREDDGKGLLWFWQNLNDPDPYGEFNRFCNHFYEPISGRGLTPASTDLTTPILCKPANTRRSIEWAIGAADPFQTTTVKATEPLRVFRRLPCLSQAATGS